MKLEFYNGTNRRLISKVNSISEAFDKINQFLEEKNYKSYYKRITLVPIDKSLEKEMEIDVGSWSEFFYINEFTKDQFDEWKVKSNV